MFGAPQQSSQTAPSQNGLASPQEAQSPARQLIADVAPISSALQDLASAHPELQQTVQQMLMLLKQGVMQSAQQMQPQNEQVAY